jgi:hypothetical protein
LSLLDRERDRKPRLKPGITWTRLVIFIVVVAVLAVVAEHFAAGTFRESDCGTKEIDRGAHQEGTCTEGNTKLVVVDRHSVLRLETLEARLLGIRQRKTIEGPAGSRTAKGTFVTFEVAVTNRTDAPAEVVAGQFMLFVGGLHSESVEVEEEYEPRSFLSRGRAIPPNGTEEGTVTFATSVKGAASLAESGNLDVVNLGTSVSPLEPEGLFYKGEYGVIRTYQ